MCVLNLLPPDPVLTRGLHTGPVIAILLHGCIVLLGGGIILLIGMRGQRELSKGFLVIVSHYGRKHKGGPFSKNVKELSGQPDDRERAGVL